MKCAELKAKYGYENIFVVTKECVDHLNIKEGISNFNMHTLRSLVSHGKFIRRYDAEHNPKYKQIVPYVILKHGKLIFATRRISSNGSEERILGNITLGHGGHINEIDNIQIGNIISNAVIRELSEELKIYHNCKPHAKYIAFINDNSDAVSRDHLGVVVLLNLSKPFVRVREVDKATGDWATSDWLRQNYDIMESWSQKMFDALVERMLG